MAAIPYEDECFFVAPIGEDSSDVRRRSDGVLDFIVKPAAEELGLRAVRADKVAKPGQITLQVVEHVLRAKAVVADLTGSNPNVFYELAIRHTAKLPVVLICETDEVDRLPFDIQQMRVIALDHRDLASAASAKGEIVEHLKAALDGAIDSPISTVLNLQALEQGTSVEQTLADIVTRIDALSRTTTSLVRAVDQTGLARASTPPDEARAKALVELLTAELLSSGVENKASVDPDGRARLHVKLGDVWKGYVFPHAFTDEQARHWVRHLEPDPPNERPASNGAESDGEAQRAGGRAS